MKRGYREMIALHRGRRDLYGSRLPLEILEQYHP